MTGRQFEVPERIYLQTHEDDGEEIDPRLGERTWCQERIHSTDVEYVRKDLFDQAFQYGFRKGKEGAK